MVRVSGINTLISYQRPGSSPSLPAMDSRPDANGIDHRRDVMHPHHPRPAQARRQRRGDRGRRPLTHRPARDRAQKSLARRADQDRHIPGWHIDRGSARSRRLCSRVLPNPIPGSMAIRSRGMPRASAHSSRWQEIVDLGHDIIVPGVDLHGPGHALHVHEDDAGPRAGGHVHHLRISAQSAEMSLMIDAPAARAPRATSALVVSIEIGTVDLGRQCLDDRDNPAQLFVESDRLGPRPARFAAEIEQVGPVGDQSPARARPIRSGPTSGPPSEKLSGVRLTIPMTLGIGSSSPRIVRPRASHRE